jgi:hypothetical protein
MTIMFATPRPPRRRLTAAIVNTRAWSAVVTAATWPVNLLLSSISRADIGGVERASPGERRRTSAIALSHGVPEPAGEDPRMWRPSAIR